MRRCFFRCPVERTLTQVSNLTLCVKSCNFLRLSLLLGVSRSIGKRNLSECKYKLALTTEENLTNIDYTIFVKDEWLFKFVTVSLFSANSTIVKNTKPFYYVSNGLTTKPPDPYYNFIMLSNVIYKRKYFCVIYKRNSFVWCSCLLI